ncbi:hypothetical protein CDAR_546681 [Caerostris darwini]|uniref:Uncharacterized protein n=1 Tax=Caerostris darwini TaxID=1538125 RepID=A0AAV4UBC7_9ARAC|nr:hypothetical protein CDAR_546681 [Caerostris darwini]
MSGLWTSKTFLCFGSEFLCLVEGIKQNSCVSPSSVLERPEISFSTLQLRRKMMCTINLLKFSPGFWKRLLLPNGIFRSQTSIPSEVAFVKDKYVSFTYLLGRVSSYQKMYKGKY